MVVENALLKTGNTEGLCLVLSAELSWCKPIAAIYVLRRMSEA
jgi:hypothetical protein